MPYTNPNPVQTFWHTKVQIAFESMPENLDFDKSYIFWPRIGQIEELIYQMQFNVITSVCYSLLLNFAGGNYLDSR